jgi:hypothetical protein
MPREHTTPLLFTTEATSSADVLDSAVGFLEGPPCRVDTNAFNRAGRSPLACLGVAAGEIAGTHSDAFREALDTQIGGQMLASSGPARSKSETPSYATMAVRMGLVDGMTASLGRISWDLCHFCQRLSNRTLRSWKPHATSSAVFGEIVFNCTEGASSLAALRAAGAANLEGKIVVDVANVLTPDGPGTESLGEQIQKAFPNAKVVKARRSAGLTRSTSATLPRHARLNTTCRSGYRCGNGWARRRSTSRSFDSHRSWIFACPANGRS